MGLEKFCKDHGLVFLSQLNAEQVRNFRNGWTLSPRTAGKHLERMKSFFRFCQDSEYIKHSPAEKLKPPKVTDAPVVPFTEEQVTKNPDGVREVQRQRKTSQSLD